MIIAGVHPDLAVLPRSSIHDSWLLFIGHPRHVEPTRVLSIQKVQRSIISQYHISTHWYGKEKGTAVLKREISSDGMTLLLLFY